MPRHPERHDTVRSVVRRARRPIPAEQIVRRLRVSDPSVGRATVYRALRALVRRGDLERYDSGYGIPDRSSDHHHVRCGECGRTTVPALDGVDRALADALARSGFEMVAHDIRIEARCTQH